MFLSVMSCFVLKSRELQLTLLPATNVIATFGKKIWCRNDREEQLPKNITRRRDIYCASTSIYRPITRMESFFSEMAILWGLLRYTTKGQKGQKNFKNQVWLKMLRIVQISEKYKNSQEISKSAK